MDTANLKTPPNRGRIIVEHNNTAALRFWIRVFELEGQIAFAQSRFDMEVNKKFERAVWAMVPIISEYDAAHIKWLYVLVLEFDALGVSGGSGVIYYADKENEQTAREHRDRFAHNIMEQAKQRAATGALTEFFITEGGKES